MTKKKKRQDDFQKVKLKVGKRKPKADNATDVNFRTKGIHLTEQLKTGVSGPTTQRHLNIKVSLSKVTCCYGSELTFLLTCLGFGKLWALFSVISFYIIQCLSRFIHWQISVLISLAQFVECASNKYMLVCVF